MLLVSKTKLVIAQAITLSVGVALMWACRSYVWAVILMAVLTCVALSTLQSVINRIEIYVEGQKRATAFLETPLGKELASVLDKRYDTWTARADALFEFFERQGFSQTYKDIYGNHRDRDMCAFEIVGRVSEGEAPVESMPLWHIRFHDGFEMIAGPGEISTIFEEFEKSSQSL